MSIKEQLSPSVKVEEETKVVSFENKLTLLRNSLLLRPMKQKLIDHLQSDFKRSPRNINTD